jgi:hypothetical protein
MRNYHITIRKIINEKSVITDTLQHKFKNFDTAIDYARKTFEKPCIVTIRGANNAVREFRVTK